MKWAKGYGYAFKKKNQSTDSTGGSIVFECKLEKWS